MERLLSREAESFILAKATETAFAEIRKLDLPYHDIEHTGNVIRRSTAIIDSIHGAAPQLLTQNDRNITIYASAFHDVVQNYTIVGGKRKRSGQNEKLSAEKALSVSLKIGLFSEKDERKIHEAIVATVAIFNPMEKTVFQPNIGCGSSLPALAVAFADINGAGFDGAQVFKKEGDLLFLEDNPGGTFNYRDWLGMQLDFAIGRKNLFQKELAYLPIEARFSVGGLFAKFDESIDAARHNLETFSWEGHR
ncbi:MAG TPA: hypothetical protein VJ227_04860 [Patescibacteria group bacterium]|nr:hypothetical protein [Patescibacteria group bacterium]